MTIKLNLSKYQGYKEVDFGEPYGALKVRPLGSNESLEINKITRLSVKAINELMALQAEIQKIDRSKIKDDDKSVVEKIDRGNKLLAEREKLAEKEIEIYAGCFDDSKKAMEMLGSLSSLAIQDLFNDIFSSRESRRK
jgi:hypothetical protein